MLYCTFQGILVVLLEHTSQLIVFIGASPTLVGSLCIRRSVMLCAECEQKNPIEKPFKFCIRQSVTLCTECEQQNPIEKPSKFCMRQSVTLSAECEQKKSDRKSHLSFV